MHALMTGRGVGRARWLARHLCVAATLGWLCAASAQTLSGDAAGLRARYDELRTALANSPFQEPLLLHSASGDDALSGDVDAVIAQPFAVAGPALQERASWCDVLILHLNTKRCRLKGSSALEMVVGRKVEQPAGVGKTVGFGFRVVSAGPDYVRVQMAADPAPADAHDQVWLEATGVDGGRTYIHVSYSYAFGITERLAMRAYLATLGREKIGFTVAASRADGKPTYIGGVRGMVERNAMRYYLAVATYVDSLAVPPAERLDKRLGDWFAATERHAPQLHEMGRDEYLTMKRNETRGMP
ncbi:MAG TPA: hypothetical protein VFZ28_19500 [Burkholderiaceae bacterium]|nr:hypothetical protein [Burkholderiaceae bacterium]